MSLSNASILLVELKVRKKVRVMTYLYESCWGHSLAYDVPFCSACPKSFFSFAVSAGFTPSLTDCSIVANPAKQNVRHRIPLWTNQPPYIQENRFTKEPQSLNYTTTPDPNRTRTIPPNRTPTRTKTARQIRKTHSGTNRATEKRGMGSNQRFGEYQTTNGSE